MQENLTNQENYISIPQQIAEADISFGAKVLYGYIYKTKKNNCSLITNKELAKKLSTSERLIRRWISELKKENFIKVNEEVIDGVKRRVLYLKIY